MFKAGRCRVRFYLLAWDPGKQWTLKGALASSTSAYPWVWRTLAWELARRCWQSSQKVPPL